MEKPGDWLRVAVGLPHTGAIKADTNDSLVKMFQHFTKGCAGEIDLISMRGFLLTEQRCSIWAQALKWNATHLLWVDSDMAFPEDALLRLLQHGKAIVGANYPRKRLPPLPTAYVDNDEYTGPLYTTKSSTGLEKVKHMGFGLCLIEMGVFDALFDEEPVPQLFHFEPSPASKYTRWSTEDVYFFKRCREKGIEAFVDHDLSKEVAHIGEFAYTNVLTDAAAKAMRDSIEQDIADSPREAAE